ncbi:FAD-binding protein [Phototrophicus methaneseepsis]|uniref:FAD-binding protein n=1 Tax=Phototrophicus methaneseepsis TaxID=2710758 RepID=A0A7S8EDR4_9CHLR|nr:FAD-dependent oxidoreductase [Phototrophicus methaneseepsis]QPC84979.1 FAD-binding protein [Phototrophicus methaneseepsis]
MSQKSQLSRRDFLRNAAVAGGAAATGFAGFGVQSVQAQDVEWTYEADVVVLGSGTGQLAAIRAAELGLSAILLEKAQFGGGTTGISGGGIWVPNNYRMQEVGIPDSRENAIEYLKHATFGQSSDLLIETYVDNANVMAEYLRSIGIDWTLTPAFNDYYPEFPGGIPEGRALMPISTIEGATNGGALARMLTQAGEERGVEYHYSTAGKRLIQDESGKVIGVVAEADGQEINVHALKGVVIATGGFDHNAEMVAAFLRGPVYYPSAVATNTGDGQIMAMAIGANLRNMNEIFGWPVYYTEELGYGSPALTLELGKPGTIVVNRFGKRFFDEASAYDPAARTFYDYDNGTHEYENIPAYAIFDSSHRSRYSMAGIPAGAEVPEWVVTADTIEGIAEALGIDAAGLTATVESFNENAAQGVDPEFKRGVSAFDQLTGGDRTRTDVANPCLAPVAEAPFYAIPVWPGALGTCGGIQINEHGQALNVWGETIPGLYAAGNASGSVMGAGYPGGGSTIGAGLTFSFLAANHMAEQA